MSTDNPQSDDISDELESAMYGEEDLGADEPALESDPPLMSQAEPPASDNSLADDAEVSGASDLSAAETSPPRNGSPTSRGPRPPVEELVDDNSGPQLMWYILKVQSNRERTVCDALRRRVEMRGLQDYFGEILVPTEDVAEFKNGKRRVVKRKLYPGYIVINMELNEDTWFVVRETPGIGDFTGSAGKPTPMEQREVDRIRSIMFPDAERDEPIKTAIPYKVGDRVRIKEGTFENFEGDVEGVDEANGRVTVMINIFGRSTPVELEHWQMEAV